MGNDQSVIKFPGYTLVSEDEQMILVKNEGGDQFIIKKFNAGKVRWTVKVCNFISKFRRFGGD